MWYGFPSVLMKHFIPLWGNYWGSDQWIPLTKDQGPDSIQRCNLTSIGNLIVEIRRSYDRLIPTMGFPILVRWHLYIESGPSYVENVSMSWCHHGYPPVNNSILNNHDESFVFTWACWGFSQKHFQVPNPQLQILFSKTFHHIKITHSCDWARLLQHAQILLRWDKTDRLDCWVFGLSALQFLVTRIVP